MSMLLSIPLMEDFLLLQPISKKSFFLFKNKAIEASLLNKKLLSGQ